VQEQRQNGRLITQPMTMNFRLSGVAWEPIRRFILENPAEFHHETLFDDLRRGAALTGVSGYFSAWREVNERLQIPRLVGQHVAQDGDRNAAGIGVGGDERIKRLQAHREGNVRVGKQNLPERISSLEGTSAEARQGVIGQRAACSALIIDGVDGTFQSACHRFLTIWLRIQREKRMGRHETFGGPVHDFPIAQIAAPAQRNRARADAAQGQGDTSQMLLIVARQDRPIRLCFQELYFSSRLSKYGGFK
jgi:hypothetical protein